MSQAVGFLQLELRLAIHSSGTALHVQDAIPDSSTAMNTATFRSLQLSHVHGGARCYTLCRQFLTVVDVTEEAAERARQWHLTLPRMIAEWYAGNEVRCGQAKSLDSQAAEEVVHPILIWIAQRTMCQVTAALGSIRQVRLSRCP